MQIRTGKNKQEIKEHGNYEFPVNVCVESIQAYERGIFLWHWHKEVELTLVLSGKMEYRVNEAVYKIEENQILFGNSNTLHAGFHEGNQECDYLSITFHPRFLYGYEKSILQTKYVDFITENENWSSLKLDGNEAWHQEVAARMREIYELSKHMPEDYELRVHMLLMEIWHGFYSYFRKLPQEENGTFRNVERIRSMLEFIQENYAQNIGLQDIAEHTNICKSECCRFFKKHMNMTIFEYLMYLRIQNSLPMLERDESITSVAGKVGFSSTAYYGQIFKRYMKCTPREYKKRHQRQG